MNGPAESDEAVGRRLGALVAERLASEPPAPPIGEVVARCRRDRRRHSRRILAGGAVSAVLLVAMVTVVAPVLRTAGADRDAGRTDQDNVAMPHPALSDMTETQVVEACRHGNQAPSVTEAFFASGEPSIAVEGTVAGSSSVVLVSADGRYWADCFVHHYAGAEFGAGMDVYEARTTSRGGIAVSEGFTCKDLDGPPSPPCHSFFVDYVDRLPSRVRAVKFTTADGEQTTIATLDGFVLFQHTGPVPPGYPTTGSAWRHPWLTQITYLDQHDRPLAAANLGTSDPKAMRVADLPLIQAVPSLRSAPLRPTE